MYLPDAFQRFLKLDSESHEAHKSKRFTKVRGILKLYLTDLIKVRIKDCHLSCMLHQNNNF